MNPIFILMRVIILLTLIACVRAPSPTPALSPSDAQIFVAPEAGIAPALDLINAAQKTIRASAYWLADKDVIDAFKTARGRGVEVRVLLENQPAANNRAAINTLQAANILIRATAPPLKLLRANYLIADDRIALITTFDWTRAAITGNRDFAIRISNLDAITEMLAVFESDWKRAPIAPTNPNLAWSPFNARQRLYALLDDARQSLDIECEELQDDELSARIASAIQRDVVVRVITSPRGDAPVEWHAQIARVGASVRLIKTPYIHGTLIIVDHTRAFVGSTRLTPLALDTYRELGVVVSDRAAVHVVSTTFEEDWLIGK